MIKVKVNRDNQKQIRSFSISGHADSGPYGHDLVCAAVTAVSFGSINAVESLTGVALVSDMKDDGGFISCTVPTLNQETAEKVQLLLEGMIVSLQSIAESYGKYIKIQDL